MMRISRFSTLSSPQTAHLWIATFALAAGAWGLCSTIGQARPAGPSPTTTIECEAFPSAILGRSVNTCVALPADYATATSTRYPVLYFLHGLFENETSW